MSSDSDNDPDLNYNLTEAEIRQAIIDYLQNEKCFDSNPVKKMVIISVTHGPAHRYILESFVEQRQYASKLGRPYRGETLPNPAPLPDMWSIPLKVPVAPPASYDQDFPGTEAVTECGTCVSTGFVICQYCGGIGISGYGHYRRPCYSCGGRGRSFCPVCQGMARIVSSTYLHVDWVLITKTHSTERGALPQDKLDEARYAKTEISVLEPGDKVKPIKFPADPEITAVAKKLVAAALGGTDWKVISMRQSVVTVPVLEVEFTYQGKKDVFYVYGEKRRIFFPSGYPGSSCGGCCCCVC